ncbi:hypothetical protein [Acidianus sp. HS-5]|uniref:hypothetical protein n=1 Tax=Acidianus sp. HS-5 TaxID=2886040 RepID=UPI001F1D80FC|nr:hypothetical protein [Acidianus sp. HS-5]
MCTLYSPAIASLIIFIATTAFTILYREILYSILNKISDISKLIDKRFALQNIDLQIDRLAKLLFKLDEKTKDYSACLNRYLLLSCVIDLPEDIKNYALDMDIKRKYTIFLKTLKCSAKKLLNPFGEEFKSKDVLLQKIDYFITSLEIDKAFIVYPSYTMEKFRKLFIHYLLIFITFLVLSIYLIIFIISQNISHIFYILISYPILYVFSSLIIAMYRSTKSYNSKKFSYLSCILFIIFAVLYTLILVKLICICADMFSLLYLSVWVIIISIKSFLEISGYINDNLERLKRFEIYKEYFSKSS